MTTIARLLSASVLVVPALTSMAADSDFAFHWGHPRPQGNSIHTILPVGGQSAYAVGEFGCVLHTADDGQTWELRQDLSGIRKHFFDVIALDADSLIVAGDAPGLYRSDDGGFNWEVVPVPVETTLRDLDILPGGDLSAAGDGGVVLVSSDQGATWTEMGPGVGEIRAHHWTADDTCIVAGDDVFHRTTNAGASWTQLGTPPSFGFNELFFVDGLNGRVNSDFERWQTTDGGATWTEVPGFSFPLYRTTRSFWILSTGWPSPPARAPSSGRRSTPVRPGRICTIVGRSASWALRKCLPGGCCSPRIWATCFTATIWA